MKRIGLALLFAAALAATAAHAQLKPYSLPPERWGEPIKDSPIVPFLFADRLEYQWKEGKDSALWDLQGWVGTDYNKLWLKSEGEKTIDGATEEADLEVLYARLIRPFWHLQAGVRYEDRPAPSRGLLALGVQGLAPYWFELEATGYLNEKGKASAELEAEYELLFTQRLILQPRFETLIAASAEPERGVGRGVNNVTLGVRLRYEFRREFAPYIGLTYTRLVGQTADIARREGKEVEETAIVAGLRIWF